MADDRQGRPLKKPGKRGHDLSAEERALWEHAARTLKPIKGKGRVHAAQDKRQRRQYLRQRRVLLVHPQIQLL